MAVWNQSSWNSGSFWGPGSVPDVRGQEKHKRTNSMKRQFYFPRSTAARPEWFRNFAIQLIQLNPTLGLPAAVVNAGVADALFCEYASGAWLTAGREFGPAVTAGLEGLYHGTGGGVMPLPVFTPPPLPPAQPAAVPPLPAVVVVAPGALDRIHALVQVIKGQLTYTEAMGLQMGLVGPENLTDNPLPTFTLRAERAGGCECVKIIFKKFDHDGVVISTRRGGGAWEMLAIDLSSPYLDERPLLVATTPEIREYRMQFFDGHTPVGGFTPVQSITVAP
jgi:hypothetical protein